MPAESTYGLSTLLDCSMVLRTLGDGAASMEEVGRRVVSYLRSQFVDKRTGDSALPLARLYVTQRADRLEPSVREYAMAAGADTRMGPDVMCLTLLATEGELDAWCDRRRSAGHKAIPLPSVESIKRLPMVSALIESIGIDATGVVDGAGDLPSEVEQRPYRVFYVEDARDHPSVPAQADFVIPYGIRSAIGFGGLLPAGELFAVVAFSSVAIPAHAVEGFVAAALATKLALLPFSGGPIFDGVPVEPHPDPDLDRRALESRAETIDRLLEVRYEMVTREAGRLETELASAEERSQALLESRQALAISEARKAAIVEGALDCVIGMDADGRMIEFNRAAEETFGWRREEVLGERLGDLLVPPSMRERHRLGLQRHRETGEGAILGRRIEVNALHRDGHEFPVELTVTPIADSQPATFTGYLRDLTAVKAAAAQLAASHERLAHIAHTLQASLLPPVLPEITGYELASTYHATGEGYEVGGDFYDVFELKDGRWALTLGDVCGKGSRAAAISALTRYTIRAAAMRSEDPREVLQTAHEAVLRDGDTRFCTAAFAELEPGSGEVRLVLGGHPQPVVVRADGRVERVGVHGHLLGSFLAWRATTVAVLLGPGDLLVLYSDGVPEARRHGEIFGEERMEEVLQATSGGSARDAVHHLERSLLDFAGQFSDDVAVVALRRRPD